MSNINHIVLRDISETGYIEDIVEEGILVIHMHGEISKKNKSDRTFRSLIV